VANAFIFIGEIWPSDKYENMEVAPPDRPALLISLVN